MVVDGDGYHGMLQVADVVYDAGHSVINTEHVVVGRISFAPKSVAGSELGQTANDSERVFI